MPLDSRQVVETLDDLLALDENIIYDGMKCYVHEQDAEYKFNSTYNETDTGNWKKISSDIEAENVKFSDGENLQQKLDDGSLGGSGTIDSELNINSTNAIQNKVVTEKFKTTQKSFEMIDAGAYEEGYFIITPPLYSHFILSTKHGEQVKIIGGGSSDSKYNAIRLSNSLESEGNRILNIYVSNDINVLYLKVAPDTSLSATGLDEPPVFRIASLPDNLTEIPIASLTQITLTQAEYDALTDEEKNNGITYFISDADTDLIIDEEVNEESVNLVTNKAVATAIKEQIDDTQAAADKTYSSAKIESLIDDTTYTPDMYDRNANGDMPIVGFD